MTKKVLHKVKAVYSLDSRHFVMLKKKHIFLLMPCTLLACCRCWHHFSCTCLAEDSRSKGNDDEHQRDDAQIAEKVLRVPDGTPPEDGEQSHRHDEDVLAGEHVRLKNKRKQDNNEQTDTKSNEIKQEDRV